MLSPKEAEAVIKKNYPSGIIQKYVEYRNLYLFMVFNKRAGEEQMDPFFSVDKNTGEYAEFSIVTDGNTREITTLFRDA